jgi:hypothetical protein
MTVCIQMRTDIVVIKLYTRKNTDMEKIILKQK